MFLIFTALPFSWQEGLFYLIDDIGVLIVFIIFHSFFKDEKARIVTNEPFNQSLNGDRNKILAIVVMVSLTIAWIINALLVAKYKLPNLYWIELTVFMAY